MVRNIPNISHKDSKAINNIVLAFCDLMGVKEFIQFLNLQLAKRNEKLIPDKRNLVSDEDRMVIERIVLVVSNAYYKEFDKNSKRTYIKESQITNIVCYLCVSLKITKRKNLCYYFGKSNGRITQYIDIIDNLDGMFPEHKKLKRVISNVKDEISNQPLNTLSHG